MALAKWVAALLLLVIYEGGALTQAGTLSSDLPQSDMAYVTLIYGEEFLLGVRVLGRSLKETGTKKDMVLLVAGALSEASEHTLKLDGWRVKRVNLIHNPGLGPQKGSGYPARFWGVYSKLQVFNMTEYKRLIYLDADTLVVRNIDVLFGCPGFCAALRHSERFNSGVMVLTPSEDLYKQMSAQWSSMPSYTGGDQGFLNVFFDKFYDGLVFDPKQKYSEGQYKYMRLPTGFNADIGLYIINSNRWMIPEENIHVIHYTLGPFKPWVWWASWIIGQNSLWMQYRDRLEADAHQHLHGVTGGQRLAQVWLTLLPLCMVLFFCWRKGADLKKQLQLWWVSSREANGKFDVSGFHKIPPYFLLVSILAGYGALLLAVVLVVALVPDQVFPAWGWFLSFNVGLTTFWGLFLKYLQLCYQRGRDAALQGSYVMKLGAGEGLVVETAMAVVFITLMLLLCPWAGSLLGVTSFIGKILATVATAVFACVTLTSMFVMLPVEWYLGGRLDGCSK